MPLYRAELLAKKPLRYAALIHDVSQVLHLPFDWDDGSYARDRSGYNNHGTICGATLASGKIGMARDFDGVDDYVEAPHSASLDITESITIAAWIKLDSFPPWGRILEKGGYATGTGYAVLALDTAQIQFEHDAWDAEYEYIRSSPISAGVWYHITCIYDYPGSTAYIYKNGDLDVSKTWTRDMDSSAPYVLSIGRGSVDEKARLIDGTVDEVRIIPRALSPAEVSMLMYRRW